MTMVSIARLAVVAAMVSGGAAMAQNQSMGWGPSVQNQYHQNYGSAPTYVSYGAPVPPAAVSRSMVQAAPVAAAPAARPVARVAPAKKPAPAGTATRAGNVARPRAVAVYRTPNTSGM